MVEKLCPSMKIMKNEEQVHKFSIVKNGSFSIEKMKFFSIRSGDLEISQFWHLAAHFICID